MGKNLFDFGDKDLEEEIIEKTEKLDRETKENIENMHEKYKDFSEQDLFEELRKQQQSGDIDTNKLSRVIENLDPFLSDSQKNFLKNTINKLEE